MHQDLASELSLFSITIKPEFNSTWIREGSQYFIGHKFSHGLKDFYMASFGNWKTGQKKTWKSWEMEGADPEVTREAEKRHREESKARHKAKLEFQESQSIKLFDEWRGFFSNGSTLYMEKKRVSKLFGSRIDGKTKELIIPCRDIDGRFWNFQRIPNDGGKKLFQKGAKASGTFHSLEDAELVELQKASTIYIAEGFATAASIAMALSRGGAGDSGMATGKGVAEVTRERGPQAVSENCAGRVGAASVVCAFYASNLEMVAKAIRERFPDSYIRICADNDAWTDGNPGITSGLAAKEAALPATIHVPVFETPKEGFTDFNDLHVAEGLESVRTRICATSPNGFELWGVQKLSKEELERQYPPKALENASKISENGAEIGEKQLGSENPALKPAAGADSGTPPPKPKKGRPPGQKYEKFETFFDEHLKGAKRDVVSGKLMEFDGQQWQSVMLDLGPIRSHASDLGLKEAKVKDNLERYVKEQKKQLLVDHPKWDGRDRIKELGNFLKLKNHDEMWPTFEDAFKEWGANIFRRLYDDGAQNRCIILKGDQGIGKDSLVRSLLSSFGPYYAKFTNSKDERDLWNQVTNRLVIHIEEFDQTGSMTVSFLKDLITRDWTTNRDAYAHDAQTKKCIGSFISSVNIDTVLRDETGNRRFGVFDVESIGWSYPKDMGPQFFAQFLHLYETGFKARKETWELVIAGNQKFEAVDMVEEMLQIWDEEMDKLTRSNGILRRGGFRPAEVQKTVLELAKFGACGPRKVVSMLKANGRSRRSNGETLYFSGSCKSSKSGDSAPNFVHSDLFEH